MNIVTNLDYNFSDQISETLFIIEYYKGEELIVEGLQVFGFLGLIRFNVPNKYSFSTNERKIKKSHN